MANPFQVAGADKVKPTRYAPIFTNRFFTGLWTQRNPLRDAATPYLYEKFYSGSRFESLIGGANVELTNRLTLKRRPGHSVFNSTPFPAGNRAYEFRVIQAGQQLIRVMLDTQASVYDATPGSPGGSGGSVIWTKSAGAQKTQFQGVGNGLYFGNAVEAKKWLYGPAWVANTSYAAGKRVIDPNGNLQVSQGAGFAIASTTVATGILNNTLSVVSTGATLAVTAGMLFNFAGLTTQAWLNNNSQATTSTGTTGSPQFSTTQTAYVPTADTGYAFTAAITPTSGNLAPTWNASAGDYTVDGNVVWKNAGPAVQNWGGIAPAAAPTAANATGAAAFPAWAATTFYSPTLALLDGNSNIQLLTTAGTTGGVQPTWNVALNGTTNDGSAQWTNKGSGNWTAGASVTAGQIIAAFWSHVVTIKAPHNQGPDEITLFYFDFFVCVQPGVTGGVQPGWTSGRGNQVADGTAVWQNAGSVVTWNGATLHSVATVGIGATTVLSVTQSILDANGNVETVYAPGKSGSVAPTWSTVLGALTTDGTTLQWKESGASPSKANVGSWTYGYAFRNSTAGFDTAMSPQSAAIVLSPPAGFNGYISVAGGCSADPQFDTIRIFRTPQQVGGGTPVFEQLADLPLSPSQIGNASATWSYSDFLTDAQLNFLILGDTVGQNSAPPTGFLPDCFHLQRIWGHVGNVVYYSNGPAALNGIGGNETLSPSNNYVMPAPVTRILANPLGIFIFTTAGCYTVPGSGTASDPLQSPKPFLGGKIAGLLSFDALAENGTLIYMFDSKSEITMIDPSTGATEIGFPIGDQFVNTPPVYGGGGYGAGGYGGGLYSPAATRVVWHDQNSTDAALYVADGNVGWYRCNLTPAPETGICWSPQAVVQGGAGLIQSVEVAPGVHMLLVQAPGGGPLLYRDATNFADNGTTYAANAILGSLVLAHPGEVALIPFLATDQMAIGSRITPSLLIEEISGSFDSLAGKNVPDPTYLPASTTIFGDRWYLSNTQKPALCRHMQVQFTWANENAGNELLTYAIFGAVVPEL